MNREQLKEKISRLTIEDQEKLKEYTDALKEIKKEIKDLLNKGKMSEGGPMVNLTLPIEEE
jgi:phage-related minor tail protein